MTPDFSGTCRLETGAVAGRLVLPKGSTEVFPEEVTFDLSLER